MYAAPAPQQGPMPQMDLSGLSQEEREMMEMINRMSPEEQQGFMMEIMGELEKEVSKLPKEEQEKFLNEFWSEVEKEAQQLEEKIKPIVNENVPPIEMEPTPAPTPVKENVPTPKPIAKTKVDEAINIIDGLLKKLEKILNKTALIPDIDIKVSGWLKDGSITPSFANWQTLKNQIELFIQQLSKLKDRDPKTRDYKYMGELVKNEVVFNNLSRVESILRSTEPSIEIPEFGATKLADKSSTALKKALSSISEAFYRLGLPSALDSIIEKYEPTAKKYSEEKAKSMQEAQKAGQPYRTTPVMSAGANPADRALFSAPTYQPGAAKHPSYGSGATPLDSFDALFSNPSSGAYGKPSEGRNASSFGGGDNVPKAAAPKGGGNAPSDKSKLPEMPKTPTPVKKEDEKKKEEEKKKKVEEDKRMEKALDNLGSAFETLNQVLVDGGFKNIQTQVLSKNPLNIQVANALQQAFNRAQSAVFKANDIRTRFNKLDNDQKKYYKTDIDSLLAQSSTIDSVIKQIDAIKAQASSIIPDKQWAFFGGEQEPENADLKNQVTTPPSPSATLDTLQSQLIELLNVLRSIK